MQKIQEAKSKGSERAQLAFDMFARSVSKGIAAMAAAMGGTDAIVFTGGIGEHSTELRSLVCRQLEFMGVNLDEKLNHDCNDDGLLSIPESKISVLKISAREEFQIFKECMTLLHNKISI
jgi:acetate kinase